MGGVGTRSYTVAASKALYIAEAQRDIFARLASLAAAVARTPRAEVALLAGDEPVVVGRFDVDEHRGRELWDPDPDTRCHLAQVVDDGEALYVEDGLAAPSTWPFRSFAGLPLRDNGGHLVGVLSVFDTVAHSWQREERGGLAAVAEEVTTEIALYRDVDRRRRLLDAFDHAPPAIALTRGEAHVVEYLNATFRSIFGDLPVEVPSREAMAGVFPGVWTIMDTVYATGEQFRTRDAPVTMVWPGESEPRRRYFDVTFSVVGRAVDSSGSPTDDPRGLLVVIVEVTDQVVARDALIRNSRRLELLARANASLNSELDPVRELQALAEVVVPELADLATVHVLEEPARPGVMPPLPVFTSRVAVAAIPELHDLPDLSPRLQWDGDGDPITTAIVAGELVRRPFVTPSPPSWSLQTGSGPVIRAGLNHIILAPVIAEGKVVAVVSFGMCGDRPLWVDEEFQALEEIARYAGVALGHGLSFQRNREASLALQRSLLSEPPVVPDLEVTVRYRPAGHNEVGGDWYDAFALARDSDLALICGDVVGHDIQAAASMGQLRASLRTLLLDPRCGPSAAINRLDRVNTHLGITPFATLLCARLRRRNGAWEFTWSSAGHPPPILLECDEAALVPQKVGCPLIGTYRGRRPENRVALNVGDTIILYTDGLYERRGVGAHDALESLRAQAAEVAGLALGDLCDALVAQAPPHDDIAVIAVRAR